MKDARPALRYAKAILNLAKEKSVETEVNADMQLIASTISENLDLEIMLKSPVIKSSDKKNALIKIFSDKIHVISLGIFIVTVGFVFLVYTVFDKFNNWSSYVDTLTTGIFFVAMWLIAKRKI